ncbi:hypothetical protein Tco_1085646, partial [Tanacetum coccineum]
MSSSAVWLLYAHLQVEEIKLKYSSRSRSLKTISRNTRLHSLHFTLFSLVGNIVNNQFYNYKNDVELEYHVDQLKAAVVSEAQWNNDEGDVSKPRSFERHMSKSSKPHPSFYNNDFYTYYTLALKRSILHLSPNIMLQGTTSK